jgi:ubiquinone/menaquinone biosynthesis C-methylase UbiE
MKIIFGYSAFLGIILISLFNSAVINAQDDLTEESEKIYLHRQPPESIITMLDIKSGMTIGEVGAGRGRMTVYFAREVGPSGKIYANDIDELSLAYLKGRCRRLGFHNVELIKGEMDDPLLPVKSLDMAVMVLVYHMLEKPDKLLENIKKSLRPGAPLVIIDPVDEEIDREFGIDRSKPGNKPSTITERIRKSAKNAGYDLVRIDSSLSRDLIFFLKPGTEKIKSGEHLVSMILNYNTMAAKEEFEGMKMDTLKYDLSEIEFRTAGYEFIGSRSYPEAVAVLRMGLELYPQSSMLYAEMGEAYFFGGDRIRSKECWQKALDLDPGNPNGKFLLENFDAIFEQVHNGKN